MKNQTLDCHQQTHSPGVPCAAAAARRRTPYCAAAFVVILCLVLGAQRVLAQTYSLGTTNLLEGPAGGTDSVVLAVTPSTQSWTATANDPWLHLSAANGRGNGSKNVVFTFDANPGPTRTGTLTVAAQTLAVTQAGSNCFAANFFTLVSSGLNGPWGMAADGAGNVYIADGDNVAIKKWTAATGAVTNLVSSGLNGAWGVAVDGAGNVYIADFGNTIKKWTAATDTVTNLISSGLNSANGVAVDGAGNVYILDSDGIKKWTATTGAVTTLMSSGTWPFTGVAVDGAGNVYIADDFNNVIWVWTAATHTATWLDLGLFNPDGVAVDGAGNVYVADYGNSAIKKWTAATGKWSVLASSRGYSPVGVAVDGAGNVYVADYGHKAIEELPLAFVDPTPRFETAAAGSDVLRVVLLAPFAPASDQTWLTITGVTNGVVSFAFPADLGDSRTAHITLVGTNIAVIQAGSITAMLDTNDLAEGAAAGTDNVAISVSSPTGRWSATANAFWLHLSLANQSGVGSTNVVFTFDANLGRPRKGTLTIAGQTLTVTQPGVNALGATALLEGPAAGTDSVVLGVFGPVATWTATANDAWLRLKSGSQNGTGSTNVVFAFDANPGPTRTGTLTIAGQTLTVTQAGSTYAAASPLMALVSLGTNYSGAVAVDGAGNVYFSAGNAIQEWMAANGSVTNLVPSGLYSPSGLAVDGAGNVYIADAGDSAIKEWMAANGTVTTLLSSGLAGPSGVAVDGVGNVYIADGGPDYSGGEIIEWTATTGTVTILYSPPYYYNFAPWGVAVDALGNVYIADTGGGAIEEWTAANPNAPAWLTWGLEPVSLAVDGGGNVYIADSGHNAIKKWLSTTGTVTTLVSSGLAGPAGVAVDGAGNVYIADSFDNAIYELPRAFVDPTGKMEPAAAGSDVLPVILPATANLAGSFAPTSDSAWLTITGVTNGVVSFAFTANPTHVTRTGHITLLGQAIPITQAGAAPLAADLTSPVWLPGGNLQFSFTGTAGASYSVLFSTNLALPLSAWTVAGTATETTPGQFQFTAMPSPAAPSGFYRVRSP